MSVPRIVIAGTGSGVGKTSLALGLVRAFARRGLRVQSFKVGPDFLDPTHLTLASGRTCYNLDTWMCGSEYVRSLFQRTTTDADIAVIEGVMGLFDGASPDSSEGSTAEIAATLRAPILLTVNAKGSARSIGAMIKGFDSFEPDTRIAGVIANHVGSQRHVAWLTDTLSSSTLPPLLGGVPADALPSLPSRHLGLVTATPNTLTPAILDALADAVEKYVDLDAVLKLARSAKTIPEPHAGGTPASASAGTDRPVTIGIARDEAFHFYYPDNLECLQALGARLVYFSPIHDTRLPESLGAVYLGGGYPEECSPALSQNTGMLDSIRQFAGSGGTIYAECGGLMYLSQGIETLDGTNHAMTGLLPFRTRMCSRRQSLGYTEITLERNSMWGVEGTTLRGHEFHYSEIIDPAATHEAWQPAYQIQYRRTTETNSGGIQRGNILAGYVHLHFASHPAAARSFLNSIRHSSRQRAG